MVESMRANFSVTKEFYQAHWVPLTTSSVKTSTCLQQAVSLHLFARSKWDPVYFQEFPYTLMPGESSV